MGIALSVLVLDDVLNVYEQRDRRPGRSFYHARRTRSN
jgi:hypothetical protein